ncbi:hypothetical protein BGZ81_006049 [Podila clonocystis]|nr:hypothetical protein BGZ81_006049 [Podila clonocystis]
MLPLEPRFIDSQHQPNATSNLHRTSFTSIGDWLRFQSKQSACLPAFTVVDANGTETCSWTWERLWTRADKICRALLGKSHLAQGDRVGLVYRKSEVLDFLAALYGCLLAGMTAVPVNVIGQLEDMIQVIQETQMGLVLTTENNYRVLMTDQQKRKTQQSEKEEIMLDWPTQVVWWKTDTLRRWRLQRRMDTTSDVEEPRVMPDLAYIEYTKAASGELRGVAVSHKTVLAQCRILALSLGSILERRGTALVQEGEEPRIPPLSSLSSTSMTSNTTVLSWLEPRQQVGLVLGGLLGVHQGHHTVFVHQDIAKAPSIWQTCLARYMTDVALGEYDGIREMLKSRGIWSACSPATTQDVSSNLKAFLIDTLSANPTLNERLATEVLGDMGVSEPHDAVFPMVSLAEHGGMVLSVRDYLTSPECNIGPIQDKMIDKPESLFDGTKEMQSREKDGNKNIFVHEGYPTYSHTVCRYLLDRHSLKHNLIKVVATGDEAVSRATELGVMLVEAFGYATPQATLAVVDSETTALCSPGHVGEIWVDSPSIAFGFWGMHKQSQATFHALPLLVNTVTMAAEVYDPVPAGFLRTNLLGGVVEGRLVVFGRCDEQIHQSVHIEGSGADCNGEIATETVGEGSEKEENSMDITVLEVYYASDLSATILERIVGFTACVVFDFFINNEVLPIVCAETSRTQRADLEMLAEYARQAMQDYHGLRPYCIAIVPQGSLPRVEDTISDQSLDCGDDRQSGIWGTDAIIARAARRQAHERVAQFSSCSYPRELVDERIKVDLAQLPNILGSVTPTTSNTFHKFGKKVVNIAKHIEKRGGLCAGDRVALLFSNSVEFVATLYACWFLGLVPVPVQLLEPARALEEMLLLIGLLKDLKISYAPILGDSMAEELLKHRAMRMHLKAHVGARQDVAVPTVLNVSQAPKMHKPLGKESKFMGLPKINASHLMSVVRVGMATTDAVVEPIALISIHYSADMRRTLVNVSHANLMAQCRAQKVQCRFGAPNAPVVSCWNTFSGLGTVYSSGIGVFSGVPTVLLRYSDFLTMPQMYLEALERYQAVNALLSADMLNRVTTLDMTTGIDRTYNLSQLRNIVFDVDYRLDPAEKAKIEQRIMHVARKPAVTVASTRLDEAFSNTHISLTFGHAFNPMITSRSYMNVDPVRLYLSLKSLRRGIVKITTEDEDPHGIWVEDCGVPVSGVTVAIVNPETCEVCMSGEIGEIWVSSEANTLEVNGLMHFAKDVENTIEQAHDNIAPGGSVVFPADRAVVFVVQVRCAADPALANLALSVMHRVMEVHQFVPDVIAVVDDTVMPRSRSKPGIKMRGKMLSLFMSAKMSSKLFIGGLSWNTSDDSLRHGFSAYGLVEDAIVIRDRETGRSRGFGFVTFASDAEAQNAIDNLHEREFEGRTIKVDRASERATGGSRGGYQPRGGYQTRGGYNNSNFRQGGGYQQQGQQGRSDGEWGHN